ncbi:12165_t:CDS:2, partial [Dentiscutata heterogama]
MFLVNISEVVLFLAFVCLLMFVEKIPVHLISIATCFAMYVIKQQLTAEFNAYVERLTVDLTTWNATFVVKGQRILTMLNQITKIGSVIPLISEQFAGLSVSMSNFSQRFSGFSLGSSSGSSQLSFSDITSTTRNHFKILFDKIMTNNNYSLDNMYNMVSVEIHSLEMGKISKKTIKNFYYNNGDFR